jgi:hypothetical protein
MSYLINKVYFDRQAKELVKLTNGTDEGGVFVPTEAIALRVMGVDKKGKASIAFTYRHVDPAYLGEQTGDLAFNSALELAWGRV